MNLNKKEKQHKHFLKLNREYNELLRKKWSIEPIKLDKPIMHGYVRYLKIDNSYFHHVDYKKMCETLQLVGQHKVYCRNKDFKVKCNGRIEEIHPHVRHIGDPRLGYYITEARREERLNDIQQCGKYLKYVDNVVMCNCNHSKDVKKFSPHYEFAKPWLLSEKTEPYWLTHYTPVDAEIESRLKEISTTMYNEHGWEKISGRYRDDWCNRGIIVLREDAHAYLHGYPLPRIDEIYSNEWENETGLDQHSNSTST
jgi:hypothetical protein